jgi:acyl-CoA synthetase (AMP-forming)/AMP-acid ligase II
MRSPALSLETKGRFDVSAGLGQSTIAREIRRIAELQPDHPAVVASGYAPLSYRELENLIEEVRAALRRAGFGRSARIAIAMRNGPQAALAIVAVACSAVSIPVNIRQTVGEVESFLAALRPDAVLVAKGADSAVRRAAERNSVTLVEATLSKDGTVGFRIAAPENSVCVALDEFDEPQPNAPAFILQTSGTSAQPKLVATSHSNMLAAGAKVRAWFDLTPQDCCLSVSPVYYAHGLHVTVFAPLLSGGTVAFPSDPSRFDYSEWFGALRPTWYSAGPTLHRLVSDHMTVKTGEKRMHTLRFVLSGGAPLARDIFEGLQHSLGVPVVEHYGSSEGMQICSNLLPPRRSKFGTVGIPWPNTVVIAGDDGRPLPFSELGEILVKGPSVFSGYLNAPELNRTRFINGWFKTGDIGSIDEEGFLTVRGRKDDLINRGGEKISPVEVEDALMRHPAVTEAAAFALPHPRLGEDVAAAVVLRPGATAGPVELREYLQRQLASFKVPRRIAIRDQLPKGQTGKILRREVAESLKQRTEDQTQIAPPQSIEVRSVDSKLMSQLAEIWERSLKVTAVSPDDDFFESGGDSLVAVDMLAELEWLTGRAIPNSILLEAPTIRQMAHRLSQGNYLTPEYLVRLNPNGSQAPLFYFHSDSNYHGYTAVVLARLLGSDQPVFAVAPHGMRDEPIPATIEAMAADRLPQIIAAQHDGPFRLCGNCTGGIIAFEVARQLVAAGKEIEMVAMLDSPTIGAGISIQLLFSIMKFARPAASSVVDRAMALIFLSGTKVQKFLNISWTRRCASILRRLRNRLSSEPDKDRIGPIVSVEIGEPGLEKSPFRDTVAEERKRAWRREQYACALANYVPKPLAVCVIYFKIDFSEGAWGRISPNTEVVRLPGNHYDYDYSRIAEHLRGRLAPVDKGS